MKNVTPKYVTRVGTARARWRPATGEELYGLPCRECEDDGRFIVHVGSLLPSCGDCDLGVLRPAPMGYDRPHRICDRCGSHWSVYPLLYFARRETQWRVEIDRGCFRGGLQEPSPLEHVHDEDSPTHGSVLQGLHPRHLLDAIDHALGGVAHIEACWGRRFRFYAHGPAR